MRRNLSKCWWKLIIFPFAVSSGMYGRGLDFCTRHFQTLLMAVSLPCLLYQWEVLAVDGKAGVEMEKGDRRGKVNVLVCAFGVASGRSGGWLLQLPSVDLAAVNLVGDRLLGTARSYGLQCCHQVQRSWLLPQNRRSRFIQQLQGGQ